jgi:hypothetical protein
MKIKLLLVLPTLFLLSSCELLQSAGMTKTPDDLVENHPMCVWENVTEENNCDITYWLKFWSGIEDESWPIRKKKIEALSNEKSDLLKKVLLSQGKSTPYQDRLRSQLWAELVLPELSHEMQRFIRVALYRPSQDLLEMESALVTLSKINTHQSSSIDEQKALLDKQQSQIDQLLNIEASIMESVEEETK